MIAGMAGALALPPPQRLDPGTVLDRVLQSGEAHAYLVEARPGRPLLVTIDQRGIDVATDVSGPDGKSLGVVDTPTGREGPESVLIEGEGLYRVEVRGPKSAPAGRYEVRLEELPRDRVEAERLMTTAARLRKQGTAEATRQSAARYGEAAGLWRSLGRRREEATAL